MTVPLAPDAIFPAQNEAVGLMPFLFREAGLDVSRYRTAGLARRQAACLRALGASSPGEAWRIITERPERIPAAIDSVLLGVTEFFRDQDVFTLMENEVIPLILRMTTRPRIWSAACSSGQELYSVALMLEQAGALPDCELLGTDCREEALRCAARGAFEEASKFGGPHSGRMLRDGTRIRVPESVRRCVRWLRRDILTSVEDGPWDLILWRNMAIYLTPEAATEVWLRLSAGLRPGGYLICGKAERPPRGPGLQRIAPSIYRKPVPGEEAYAS
jgi:chemotaxis methyl-accepting protein methylase